MLLTDREKLKVEIEELVRKLGPERSSLLPVLQEIQRRHYYISSFAMQIIADLLKIHPVEIYSVVSFYGFLHRKQQGRFMIRLCRTLSCEFKGKDALARQLENDLGIKFGQTTPDGTFTLEWVNCIGMCDEGPAIIVNDKVYTSVTPDRVNGIIEECRRTFGVHAVEKKVEHI